jgi:molybdenum cofactor guanylyltransferase
VIDRGDVSALILAGGKATRFGGVDKRELRVDGHTIFERQCAVLSTRVAEIIVSSPRPVSGHRTVADRVAGAGPLAGIAAGLQAATTPWLLVLAGDMPNLSAALVDLLLARIADDHDARYHRVGGLPEPLVSALRVTACAPVVTRRLAARAFKASRLFTDEPLLRVTWIDEPELRAIDPELRAFFNVNAPEDLV